MKIKIKMALIKLIKLDCEYKNIDDHFDFASIFICPNSKSELEWFQNYFEKRFIEYKILLLSLTDISPDICNEIIMFILPTYNNRCYLTSIGSFCRTHYFIKSEIDEKFIKKCFSIKFFGF